MKPWNELSRAEKIKHIFDYPESMRNNLVKDLWGPDASVYCEHIYFPPTASWEEVVEVIKSSRQRHSAYIQLTYKDFKTYTPDELQKECKKRKNLPFKFQIQADNEYHAFMAWRKKILHSHTSQPLNFELYDENSILCRVCTGEGDYGDEYGFGVEPDMWASAIFDFTGKIIQPFAPGFIKGLGDKY